MKKIKVSSFLSDRCSEFCTSTVLSLPLDATYFLAQLQRITALVRDDVVGTSLETACCFWTNIIMRGAENWSIHALRYHCVLNFLFQNTAGEWSKLAEPSKQDTSTKNMATLRWLPATKQWKRCFKNLFPLYSDLFHIAILVVHKNQVLISFLKRIYKFLEIIKFLL